VTIPDLSIPGSRGELAYPYRYFHATVKFVANVRRLTFRLRTARIFWERKNYDRSLTTWNHLITRLYIF